MKKLKDKKKKEIIVEPEQEENTNEKKVKLSIRNLVKVFDQRKAVDEAIPLDAPLVLPPPKYLSR